MGVVLLHKKTGRSKERPVVRFTKLDEVEDQRQNDKGNGEPLRHLGKTGIPSFGLGFGHEGVRTAGDGTGQTRALAALEQDDHGHGEAGDKLEYGQSKLHNFFTLFKISQKII